VAVEEVEVYVGLGSNLEQPHGQLERALTALSAIVLPNSLRRSGLYRSEPLGPPGQPDYLNAAVSFRTRESPRALLCTLQAVERGQGRKRAIRWGARTLDLDILLYGQVIVAEPDLRIPHPAIPERVFVLRPLQDLNPELNVPGMGTLSALIDECPASRIEPANWGFRAEF